MAGYSGSPVSKNFEDRTWQTVVNRQLNSLFDFLNRPRDTKKSYKDPFEQVYAHARPLLPSDPALLNEFFKDQEPDEGSTKKSYSKSRMYNRYLLEEALRRYGQNNSSPMTQGQLLGGGYDE